MKISKLQKIREIKDLSIQDLAVKSLNYKDCGDTNHMILTIRSIERGQTLCPKPRKTYEWFALAKALDCKTSDIM